MKIEELRSWFEKQKIETILPVLEKAALDRKPYLDRQEWLEAAGRCAAVLSTCSFLPSQILKGDVDPNKITSSERKTISALCQTANDFSKCCYFLVDKPPQGLGEDAQDKIIDVSLQFLNREREWAANVGDEETVIKASGNIVMFLSKVALIEDSKGNTAEGIQIAWTQLSKMPGLMQWARIIERDPMYSERRSKIGLNYVGNFYNHLGSLRVRLGELLAKNAINKGISIDEILQAREAFKAAIDLRLGFLKDHVPPGLQEHYQRINLAAHSNMANTYILDLLNSSFGDIKIDGVMKRLDPLSQYLRDFFKSFNTATDQNRDYLGIETNVRCAMAAFIFLKLRTDPVNPTLTKEYYEKESVLINLLLTKLGNKELPKEINIDTGIPIPRNLVEKLVESFLVEADRLAGSSSDMDLEDRVSLDEAHSQYNKYKELSVSLTQK